MNVDASPATRKLYEATLLVEACGCSPELTTAVGALGELAAILHADVEALHEVQADRDLFHASRDRFVDVLRDLAAMHVKMPPGDVLDFDWCNECVVPWPCATFQAMSRTALTTV